MESKVLRQNTESFYFRFFMANTPYIHVEDKMKVSNYNRLLIFFVLLFVLSGYATTTWQQNKKATIGGLGGAAAGGLIASAFNANTAGIVGGVIEIHLSGTNHSLLINDKTRWHRQRPGIITVECRQAKFVYFTVDPVHTVRQSKGHFVLLRHQIATVTQHLKR